MIVVRQHTEAMLTLVAVSEYHAVYQVSEHRTTMEDGLAVLDLLAMYQLQVVNPHFNSGATTFFSSGTLTVRWNYENSPYKDILSVPQTIVYSELFKFGIMPTG